jgi:purine-binding chemotaxis protein CheW
MRFLLFTLDEGRYAVSGDAVAEIVRAVAVTRLPNAPAVVEGVIDLRGLVIPVFDLRRRFNLPSRAIELADHFIIVRTTRRMAVLHVDRVLDFADIDDHAVTELDGPVHAASHVAGVATLADGLAVIHDVETFLSRAEEESLDAALAAEQVASGSSRARVS